MTDPEGGPGSIAMFSPSPTLLSYCTGTSTSSSASPSTTVPDGEPDSKRKPKKKRAKPRFRNAIKELNQPFPDALEADPTDLDHDQLGSAIHKKAKEVQEMMGMTNDFHTVALTEAHKQKKIRKRKKVPNEADKMVEQPCNEEASMSQRLPDLRNDVDINLARKEKSHESPKKQQGTSTKNREPFFADNRKGAVKKNSKATNTKKTNEKEVFEEYLTVAEVEQGLRDKTMVAGAIRINPRCYKEAYIPSEGDEKDIMIEGLKNRNRALESDEVVVLLNPPEAWKSSGQRTGKVVYIREQFHSRHCIGKLPPAIEPGSSYIMFSPRDSRVPRLRISLEDCSLPPVYLQNPSLFSETLFNAQITAWNDVNYGLGSIIAEVGKSGDVEAETLAILLENNLDHRPISPQLNIFFPRMPYTIPPEEINKRLDLRKECIFTIDPLTARDLDDAVSVKRLDNGNIEVGVHISDVSHFLHYNTMLDNTVSKRATTIYLVQRVYHMLPVELCQLCSLTPGEDKLAFSVFIELTTDAKVVSHRFARSIIHSCVQLAYEHAQLVIDNPEKSFTAEDFPAICNGCTPDQCAAAIRELFKLSVIMRKRRFDTGALRIDQPKLCFHLDPDTQRPLSSFIYENKESHRLIEEFMLLANMTVAEHIYAAYPKLAFLRHHLPPRINMMSELQKRLEMFGVKLDISDAGALHSSMVKYSIPRSEEDVLACWAKFSVLNNLCAKPMLRAEYFCPSEENPDLHHYALNAECYTHFTSPIRRYADIMVHRLLAASLDLDPQPTWKPIYSKRIAMICNRQKLAAKLAGEQSSLLFLALFLSEPVECTAAVIDVKDRSFDVIVKEFGIVLRCYTDPLPATVQHSVEDASLYIQWKGSSPVQLVQLFSIVRVQVSRSKDSLKLAAVLLPPLRVE